MVHHPVLNPLTPTIFHEPWWLEIVSCGRANIVQVSQGGKVVGQLPYFLNSKYGLKYSVEPPLLHFSGPAIVDGEGSPETRFLNRLEITVELIAKLPPAAIYRMRCHRGVTDVLAFQTAQWSTGVQFTYEILPQAQQVLWGNLRQNKRRKIKKARESLTIASVIDPGWFWAFYMANLQQRGVTSHYDKNITLNLIAECIARNCGRIYAAQDKNGEYVAAIFVIWDTTSAHYFMTTRTQAAHGGAISLLVWEAMCDAAQRGLIFDFDGVVNPESILFYTEFAGVIAPRYIVTRTSWLGRLSLALSESCFKKNQKNYFC